MTGTLLINNGNLPRLVLADQQFCRSHLMISHMTGSIIAQLTSGWRVKSHKTVAALIANCSGKDVALLVLAMIGKGFEKFQ